MRIFLVVSLFLCNHFSALPQDTLLYLPISSNLKTKDLSSYKHFFYIAFPGYSPDRLKVDSSALSLGMRKYITITPDSAILAKPYESLEFSLWFRLDTLIENVNSSKNDPGGMTDLFVHGKNAGIIYNYADSSIQDLGSNVKHKIKDIYKWHHATLLYTYNETALFIDGRLMQKTFMDNDLSLNNEDIKIGTFNQDYFYGHIDEIRLVATHFQTTSLDLYRNPETSCISRTYFSLDGKEILTNQLQDGKIYLIREIYPNRHVKVRKEIINNESL